MFNRLLRYWVLVLFVGLTIVGVVVGYFAGSEHWLWNAWQIIDVSFAVAIGVLAFLGYRELIASEDEISIYFEVEGEEIDTGINLLRRDCSRSEVMGVLGMIRKNESSNYNIESLKNRKILKELNQIQKGKEMKFVLKLSQEEREQFSYEDSSNL